MNKLQRLMSRLQKILDIMNRGVEMPRQWKMYKDFSGGLNTHSNPSDILDNEFVAMHEMEVKDPGRLIYLGSGTEVGSLDSYAPSAAAGATAFKMDADGYEYLAVGGTYIFAGSTTVVQVVRKSGASFTGMTGSPFTLGAVANGNVIYYFAGSQLRMCDANFTANANKWLGNISRTLWSGTSYTETLSGYYFLDAEIKAPTRGVVYNWDADDGTGTTTEFKPASGFGYAYSELNSKADYILVNVDETPDEARTITAASASTLTTETLSGSWNGDSIMVYTPSGDGFCLFAQANTGGGTGTWANNTVYEFASTFIYDNVQESLPYVMPGYLAIADSGTMPNPYVRFRVCAIKSYNARITGGRIYYRKYQSQSNWTLLMDIDFSSGVQFAGGSFEQWGGVQTNGSVTAPSNSYYNAATTVDNPPAGATYTALTSVSKSEHTITAKWKTACVLNNVAWIGHVQQEDANGATITYGKRVMYSEVGRFDIFPSRNYFDLNTNESITRIAGYADRILVFTENQLFIINVSSSQHFVENEHRFMGALNPGAVHEFHGGVIWTNPYGVYLFNGETIIDLLVKNNRRMISKTTWKSYITTRGSVGYSPGTKKVFVIGDVQSAGGNVYILKIDTQTWSTTSKFGLSALVSLSNFVLFENEICWADASRAYAWSETDSYAGNANTLVTFKNDDFNLPHNIKRIYGFIIGYSMKSGTSDLGVRNVISYSLDDGVNWVTTGIPDVVFTHDTANETQFNLIRAPFTSPVSAEKIMFKIATTSSLRINEFGVEYRPIYKRPDTAPSI